MSQAETAAEVSSAVETGDAVGFDDLVMVATVGVARRPLPIGALGSPAAGYTDALAAGDPAEALLDAAALLDAGRRAGVRPAHGVSGAAPAADEDTPELSARAGRVLRHVASFDTQTLADLLIAASAAGFRAPAPLLPMLLEIAVRSKAPRPAVAAVLGARGRWLAAQHPEWRRVMPDVDAPAGPAATSKAEIAVTAQTVDTAALRRALDDTAEAVRAAAIAEVAAFPGPWPDDLADAIVSLLARTVAAAPRSRLPRELIRSAAGKLPVTGPRDHAAELGRCADMDTCPAPWAAMLRRAAEIIAARRAFYEEIL